LRRDENQVTLPNGRVVQHPWQAAIPRLNIAVLKCAEASNAAPEFGDAATLNRAASTLVVAARA